MKFTLSWLQDHLDTDASVTTITDTLTAIGLELEGVEDRGAALAPFKVARITEAAQHPNADRLRVCQVDVGGAVVQVVCGAPNARAGLHVVFAPPGTFIPGSGITIKVGEIRGVQSQGMLCSLRELGLPGDADGIAELSNSAEPGRSYAEHAGLADPVIDIAITPNRGDALAVRGIARDLAAAGLGTLRPLPAPSVPETGGSTIAWRNDWPEACPWIVGRTVRGVRNGPSPDWLQARLTAIGLRPINALVDITNYLAVDLGRPLHVFDASRITGTALQLRPGNDETFRALNGHDVTVTPDDCVIADADAVQSLGGIIGGEASGCTDGTSTVFIECALFDPVRIAQSGRAHGITSDARQRFERGIDPHALPAMLDIATRMILDLCGGEANTVVTAGAEPNWQRCATLRFDRLMSLGGATIAPDQAVTDLERLGFTVQTRDADSVTVQVPPWRNDVASRGDLAFAPDLPPEHGHGLAEAARSVEAECDLIEEVLRLRGLDAIPAVSLPPLAPIPRATTTPAQTRTALARRTLAAAGLVECVTFSFVDHDQARRFGAAPEALRVLNPIASDLDQMRPSILATLAHAAARNAARTQADLALFEIGPCFHETGQTLMAAGLRCGRTALHPACPARDWDTLDAKADMFAVLAALGVPQAALQITTDAPAHYHPGRSGTVRQGPKQILGRFGELHPNLVRQCGLTGRVVAFEIDLNAIPEPKRRKKAAPSLPTLQPVRRDMAFMVAESVQADSVLRAIRGSDRALIADVQVFDIYSGKGMPDAMKSIAVEILYQPQNATLNDGELGALMDKAASAVQAATGGLLRSGG